MANYWDYPNQCGPYWRSTSTTTTSTTGSSGTFYYGTSTSTSTWPLTAPQVVWVQRHYLIEEPEHWTDQDAADFTYLVNDATKTGFKVLMRMKGDVQIADPNVEKRSMADFVPLLLSRAQPEDQEVIRDFFEKHPLTALPA